MSIAGNIVALRQELPKDVTLVAVSKFHTCEEIMQAYQAGQKIFGESRPQELKAKAEELPKDIEWHFIGHLQTNKIKITVPYVKLIHSVDSSSLFQALEDYCGRNGHKVDVLLEMHIASEETKQGFSRVEILEFISAVAPQHLRIRGLMGMASLTEDEELIRSEFGVLNSVFEEIRSMQLPYLADFNIKSYGMSGDYRTAVECGSNMVRIGTHIFGPRDYSR